MLKRWWMTLALCLALVMVNGGAATAAMSDDEFVSLCGEGTASQVEAALAKGANPNAVGKFVTRDGMTALMNAAWTGTPEVVSILLKAGADVNAREPESGFTALMRASQQMGKGDEGCDRNPKVINILLKAGADVNARAFDDQTAADMACDKKVIAILKKKAGAANKAPALIKAEAMAQDFIELCLRGTPSAVRAALKKGANPNVRPHDYDDDTPLLVAVTRDSGNLEVVSILLQAGADVNARDKFGTTPLMKAIGFINYPGGREVVDILLKAGADVNARTFGGQTVLDQAETPEAKAILIKAGAKK